MGLPAHSLSPTELAALRAAERQGAPFIVYRDSHKMNVTPLLNADFVRSGRTVLLRPRSGRVLLEHLIIAAVVTASGAAAGAAVAVILGHPSAVVAVIAITVAPLLTLCAAMSARRGGRVPQTLLVTAIAADPTGGGTAVAGWFARWPSIAVVIGVVPLVVAHAGGLALTAIWIVAAAAVLTWLAGRDTEAESSL